MRGVFPWSRTLWIAVIRLYTDMVERLCGSVREPWDGGRAFCRFLPALIFHSAARLHDSACNRGYMTRARGHSINRVCV